MKSRLQILVLACALLSAPTAAGEEEGRRVSLAATLGALFRSSPAFSLYAAQTHDAKGALLRTSGAFDLVATAGVKGQRTLWPAATGALSNRAYTDAVAQAGVSMHTRENVSLQVTGSVPFASTLDSTSSPDQPQVTGNITVPLLKFGRSTGPAADERAAALHASAAAAAQQDSESDLTAQVTEQYWNWVGSYEQLKLTRRLEALATDQLRDVDELIANHARASVDRLAFAAAAEAAAATLAQAEQAMFAQGQLLWETIGLAPPSADALPQDALPPVASRSTDSHEIGWRAHDLARGRPLLRALDDEVRAAAVRKNAARIGLRPDLDLSGQGTALRVDDYYPSGLTQLGYYGIVSLQASFPVENRTARGAYAQASAAHDASTLNATRQRNAIDARLDTLGRAISTLAATFQERTLAAEQFRQEYEAARLRFRLGSATATDVVVAEQQYMRASLALVADNTSYAVTLAAFAHEAGALNQPVQARDPIAVAARLTTAAF